MQALLLQVLANAEIICEVAVMDQRFMHADERMRSTRMPDSSFGRIPLMRNPTVRVHVLKLVIFDRLFGVANQFKDEQVAGMAHDKCPFFAQGCIESTVELVGMLKNKFVF